MIRRKYISQDVEGKVLEYIASHQNWFAFKSDINNAFARYKKTHKIIMILRDLLLDEKIKTHIYRGGTCPAQVYWMPQKDHFQEKFLELL